MPNKILFQVIKIAIKAGRRIMTFYGNCNFDTKIDSSPITQADRDANRIILQDLSQISSHKICSEESILAYEERKNLKYYWLVDPLDGTKDFLACNGYFSVNIALMHQNKPILGVIYAPFLDVVYCAMQGFGAFKITNCKENNLQNFKQNLLQIKGRKSPPNLVACISMHHHGGRTQEMIQYYQLDTLKMGSALKFCMLAEGVADLYPRFAGTKEWDIAAGDIILQEAGGVILNANTKEMMQYNKRDLSNDDFLAFSQRDHEVYEDFIKQQGFFLT